MYRIEDTDCVKKLFEGWEESLIWTCLEGVNEQEQVMGAVYADDLDAPGSAIAVLGDFCFLAGAPNPELVKYRPGGGQNFIIMEIGRAHV